MKKSDLCIGFGFVAAGLLCLLTALLWETALDGILCGLCGAFTVPGIVQIYKYLKWTRPENAPIYQERLEQEQIDLRDERKAMLRDRSGRYAYLAGLLFGAAAMLVFAVLKALNVIESGAGRLVILFLGGYLLFELIAGQVIYGLLEKRY